MRDVVRSREAADFGPAYKEGTPPFVHKLSYRRLYFRSSLLAGGDGLHLHVAPCCLHLVLSIDLFRPMVML